MAESKGTNSGGLRANARRLWGTVRQARVRFMKDVITQMAAALTYRTIFSLIPMLVVGLVVVRGFTGTDELVNNTMQHVYQYLGLNEIEVNGDAGDDSSQPEGTQEGAQAIEGKQMPEGKEAKAEDTTESVTELIESLVERIGTMNFEAIGIVGVLVLIYSAVSLMAEVESSFNRIYRAQHGRSWMRRVRDYWFVLTFAPLLLVAGFVVSEQFQRWIDEVASGELGVGEGVLRVLGYMVTVSITGVLLMVSYVVIPNTRVSVSAAARGALIAALVWEISKSLFREYLQGPAVVTFYGSLALLPLFLLWVYLTWTVVLFGLRVAYGLQYWGQGQDESTDTEQDGVVVDPVAGVGVIVAVARAFAKGRVVACGDVAGEAGLSSEQAQRLLERMAEAGLVRHVGDEAEDDDVQGRDEDEVDTGWVLARPAEGIGVREVIEATVGCVGRVRQEPACGRIEQVRQRMLEACGERTVADMVCDEDAGELAREQQSGCDGED